MRTVADCQCTRSFTCGYCCRNAKPYFFTPNTRSFDESLSTVQGSAQSKQVPAMDRGTKEHPR